MVWPRDCRHCRIIIFVYCISKLSDSSQWKHLAIEQRNKSDLNFKTLVKIIICKFKEQETRKMDGCTGKLLLHAFSYFIYVVKKIKLYFVQVVKSRGYISWSRDLKGHVDIHAIQRELCLLSRTSRNKISLYRQHSLESEHS